MGAAPFSENGAVSRYAAVLSTDGSIIALNGGDVWNLSANGRKWGLNVKYKRRLFKTKKKC